MKRRKLGKAGLEVSEIGFGAWGIGGTGGGAVAYGRTDDRESCSALQLAYELGVTYYDTSDFYGFGHSECLIGQVLGGVRSKIIIGTKVGFTGLDGKQDFSEKHIFRAVEESLRRLRTDYIDIYYLHSPPVEFLKKNDNVIQTLHGLVKEGKVRAVGFSARSPDEALIGVKELGFKVVQANFSLVDQRALENGLFDFCVREGIGVIARTPLCFGFLTGRYSHGVNFDSTDHRKSRPQGQIKRWAEAVHFFSHIFEKDAAQSSAQFALRFCLSQPAVATVIPGMLTREHVAENVQASPLGILSLVELEATKKIYQANNFLVKETS